MTMADESKGPERVTFSRGYGVCIMGIDGTWRRDCMLNAISDNDAILTVEGSIQGLNLKEFFLLLSSTGLAYRRCELVRVNGAEIDVQFLLGKHKKKGAGASPSGSPHAGLIERPFSSREPVARKPDGYAKEPERELKLSGRRTVSIDRNHHHPARLCTIQRASWAAVGSSKPFDASLSSRPCKATPSPALQVSSTVFALT